MMAETFLPALTVADHDDAKLVAEALNVAFTNEPEGERRQRLAALFVAAHAEARRTENQR